MPPPFGLFVAVPCILQCVHFAPCTALVGIPFIFLALLHVVLWSLLLMLIKCRLCPVISSTMGFRSGGLCVGLVRVVGPGCTA